MMFVMAMVFLVLLKIIYLHLYDIAHFVSPNKIRETNIEHHKHTYEISNTKSYTKIVIFLTAFIEEHLLTELEKKITVGGNLVS
jgi:Na+-transporting methylmalonyl-CoA/oxaloacetate decarboxylase gamma subunit